VLYPGRADSQSFAYEPLARMKFVRLAIIEFIDLKVPVANTSLSQGDQIRVELYRLKDAPETGRVPYVASATSSQLGTSEIKLGELTLDERTRLDCEYLIEAAANTIACCYGCQRRVWSLLPAYALLAETSQETAKLLTLKVYPHEIKARPPVPWIGTQPAAYLEKLMDRLEGAAVMAECMNNSTYLGRYRECIRLFELAFKRPVYDLERPLWKFLEPAAPKYSRAEVKDWLSFRDKSIHADKKKSTRLAFERDVQRFMDRMRQAAQEVLFNKAHWHHTSSDRRVLWQPVVAVLPDGGLQAAGPVSVRMEFLDCFYIWPAWMERGFSQPPGWWLPASPRQDAPDQGAPS
jgi:hypothetical protein